MRFSRSALVSPLVAAALGLPALVASASASASSPASEPCPSAPGADVAYSSIAGVDPNLLSLDVAPVAGSCEAPVAIWVHGGGWRVGDKSNNQAAREAFYNAQGWVLVSVNYRLTTDDAEPPVLFPDHNEDVAAAVAWVDEHIADYGGDPSRVMLVGHSAGAGISAALTADPTYLQAHDLDPSWLDCVVLLDTEGYDVAAMAAPSNRGELGDIYRSAFGDDPATWAQASPSEHVGDGPLPARVLIVTRGLPERKAKARSFADQLTAAGADAEIVDASPLSHADVNKLIGAGDDVMTPLMTAELERCSSAGRGG